MRAPIREQKRTRGRGSYLNRMYFLIEYDRTEGQLVTLRTFDNSERKQAQDTQLELELNLNKSGIEREVVILEAVSEGAVRLTHRRYFEDLDQLVADLKRACY